MKKLIFIILCFVLLMWFFTVDGQAATYSYYFATTGGGSTCSEGSPCATIADCKTKITAADTNDTVTCYFAQGDTWTYNSKQVSLADPYGM